MGLLILMLAALSAFLGIAWFFMQLNLFYTKIKTKKTDPKKEKKAKKTVLVSVSLSLVAFFLNLVFP